MNRLTKVTIDRWRLYFVDYISTNQSTWHRRGKNLALAKQLGYIIMHLPSYNDISGLEAFRASRLVSFSILNYALIDPVAND